MKTKYFRFYYSRSSTIELEDIGLFENFDRAAIEASKRGGAILILTSQELDLLGDKINKYFSYSD